MFRFVGQTALSQQLKSAFRMCPERAWKLCAPRHTLPHASLPTGCSGVIYTFIINSNLSDLTFTFHFHALEKEMATHSSVLAWRIPGTGEPGGLPSMGSAKSRTRLKRLSSSSNIHNYQGAPLSAPTYVTLHFQDYISPDTNTTAEFSHSCLPHTHFMLCPS